MQPPKTMIPSQTLGCPPGSLAGGLTRTRFFDGMFLTQADLSNEQVYWQMKRRLTNRALGTGVVWGLRLELDVKTQTYRLGPGYALDCCGNDLVVECPITISQSELYKRSQDLLTGITSPRRSDEAYPFSVVLQYVECPDAIRPVHRDACTPSGSACEPSRIRESCRLLLVPRCVSQKGCDGIAKFTGVMEKVRAKLGVAEKGASRTWAPNLARGGDARQTLGSVLMLFLHGYLATADTYKVSAESRILAGTLLQSSAAWLWDVDLANADDGVLGEVSTALGELAKDLCDGLLYPGPRCRDDLHGVYLGSGTMSPTGSVLTFSQWGCRREVLTGPLLDWWACQLGVEPLDVIVNDLAAKSCEAGRERDVITALTHWREVYELVKTNVSKKQTVHAFDFVGSIARTLTGVGAGSGLVAMEATAPNGLAMSAVVPATAVASSDTTAHIAGLIQPHLVAGGVPALSRSPMRNALVDLAAKTKVVDVATGVAQDVRDKLGGMTVATLLASEPESVLATVGGNAPSEAQRAAVDQVYAAAEGFVRESTTAAVANAAKR